MQPSITILHKIPGRIRMRLSCHPKDIEQMRRAVKGHEGILSLKYTPVTRSLLIHFETDKVSRQEIVLRVALCLSRDNGLAPVRVLACPEQKEMSDSAAYAGMLLIVALLTRLGSWNTQSRSLLDWSAALGTTGAALKHGLEELQSQGNFHPETLSVVYLISAMTRGNLLPAAIFTWATTFGRHLLHLPPQGIQLRAIELAGSNPENPHYEVVISPDQNAPNDSMLLFRLLPSVVMDSLGWGAGGAHMSMLDEIRELSRRHGEVLEGLGEIRDGITVRIR